MTRETAPCLAYWPCVELVRQYELLRVRSYYEDLCGSFMHRELQRARDLVRGEGSEGASQKGVSLGDSLAALRNSVSGRSCTESFRELTPRESFNRWLMERRSVPAKHADPLIPSIQRSVRTAEALNHVQSRSCRRNQKCSVPGRNVTSFVAPAAELASNAPVTQRAGRGLDVREGCETVGEQEEASTQTLECMGTAANSTHDCSPTATLEREILEDLPIKALISSVAAKSREYLAQYARAVSLIMLEERPKVERVSLDALFPLVEALLMLLRSERGLIGQDNETLGNLSSASGCKTQADLLGALSLELRQQRRTGLARSQDGVTEETLCKQAEGGNSSTDIINSFLGEQRPVEGDGEATAAKASGDTHCAFEPPAAAGERRGAGGKQEVYNTSSPRADTPCVDSASKDLAKRPSVGENFETNHSVSAPTGYVRMHFTVPESCFSKDDVYYTVCLARPVVRAIYGDAIRALLKNLENVAQEAAARVARYAACLALDRAADGKDSSRCTKTCNLHAADETDNHTAVPNTFVEAASLPRHLRSMQGATYGDGQAHTQRDANVGAELCVRTVAMNGNKKALLATSAGPRHNATRAAADRGFRGRPACRPRAPPGALADCFVVNNIRWISCKGYECFAYVGDVEMLAWDDCEPLRRDIFRSFRSRYTVKGYKVAQLWARYVFKKLGQKNPDLVKEDCMRRECVCKGKGWCTGEWTCSCVRKQIQRIRSSEYAVEFTVMVFCLLCRYYSVCGCRKQGKGLHSAAPTELMQVLSEHLGVECELFASPLNVSLPNYCSLFPDIDTFFGSEGSFFDPNFTIVEGSYEANPPFEEVVMGRLVSRIEHWLDVSEGGQSIAEAQRPLSFCVLVPYWPAGPSQYMHDLVRSRYMRFSLVLSEGEHYFLSGFQHFCPGKDVAKLPVCKTLFAVLQNQAGAKKWPVTPAFAERVKATWRPAEVFSTHAE